DNLADGLSNVAITKTVKQEFILPEKFFSPKNNFLPDEIKVAKQRDELDTLLSKDNNGKRFNNKTVKHLRKLLQTIVNSHAHSEDSKESRHAFREDNCTFDAYIQLDSVDVYSSLDDKLAFIELNLRNFKGFLGVEYNRIDRRIIAKNKSYNGMLFMIRQFNNHFTSK